MAPASTNPDEDKSLIRYASSNCPYGHPRQKEGGFVLIGALLIMLLLVLVGISATTSTILELQISGAERVHRETFHNADGGTQLAARLVEESLGSSGGFTALKPVGAVNLLKDPDSPNDSVLIYDTTLWNKEGVPVMPTDAARDVAYFPDMYNPALPDAPHTNINVSGVTITAPGSGLQMVAGYEGKGKGSAGGGGQILYTIFSQHKGRSESESVVQVGWRHVVGLELESRY